MSHSQTQIKGLFNSIAQKEYKKLPTRPFKASTKIITEEYDAYEVLPGIIYNYDLGLERFVQLLETAITHNSSAKFPKVYTNYYYYQHILSIYKGKKTGFVEKLISQKWLDQEQKHQKISEVSNVENPCHLMNQHNFHMIARVVRYKINSNETLEIIIPDPKFKINYNNFTSQLLQKETQELLNFPENTTFIRKKVTQIKNKPEKNDNDQMKCPTGQPGPAGKKPYIPKNRRRRMHATKAKAKPSN